MEMLVDGFLVRRWARGEPNSEMSVPFGVKDMPPAGGRVVEL